MVALKKIALPALAVCLIAFSSCQKDSGNNPDIASSLPRTYTEQIMADDTVYAQETFNLAYDAQNRLVSMKSVSVVGDDFIYAYPGSSKMTLDLYGGGQLSIHSDYFINGSNLVDSNFQYNDEGDSSTQKYIYNSQNQLVQEKFYNYSALTGSELWNTQNNEYDALGNMIKSTDQNQVVTYDYYTDLKNPVTALSPYQSIPPNLVKTETVVNGGITLTLTHTYTFDNQNRMLTDKAVDIADNIIATKTYTY